MKVVREGNEGNDQGEKERVTLVKELLGILSYKWHVMN